MTITYSRYLEPPDITNGDRLPKEPPRVWHAVDPPFRGYQAMPSDGYQKSSHDTAIVIDNGMQGSSGIIGLPLADTLRKVPVLYALDGPLTLHHGCLFPQMWPDIETENSIGP